MDSGTTVARCQVGVVLFEHSRTAVTHVLRHHCHRHATHEGQTAICVAKTMERHRRGDAGGGGCPPPPAGGGRRRPPAPPVRGQPPPAAPPPPPRRAKSPRPPGPHA